MKSGQRRGDPAPAPGSLAETWKPGPARPGGDWSHRTLIAETRRFVEARNLAHNPPLPGSEQAVKEPAEAERRKSQRLPQARRRARGQRTLAALLLLGGLSVLALNVLSLHGGEPDAVFFLSLIFGVVLLGQGLRLLPWFGR